jgi:hypothetical protein
MAKKMARVQKNPQKVPKSQNLFNQGQHDPHSKIKVVVSNKEKRSHKNANPGKPI